jgi:hypothetical protein
MRPSCCTTHSKYVYCLCSWLNETNFYRKLSALVRAILTEEVENTRCVLRYYSGLLVTAVRWHSLTPSTWTLLNGNCYGVVSYKVSHALRAFSDTMCVPIWVLIVYDSSTRAFWQISEANPVVNQGETWRKMSVIFAGKVSLSYFAGIFNI